MKIILFGSTGMLGNCVLQVLSEKYQTFCITRKEFDIENDSWIELDKLLQKEPNDDQIIINCAGIIPQNVNNDNFRKYVKINALFPHKLQEISNKYNYKFIHITTDCVFDGLKGNYVETDIHNETNIYGISKSLGEPEDACIIRTSIIGEELLNKKSLLEWIISQKDKTIQGYTNYLWNGVTCLTLANIIKDIIINNNYWIGVRHIFSPNCVSKYDLCNYINEIYNLNITICKYESKIIDKSLNTSYNNLIKYNILDIKQQLKLLYIFNSTIHIFGKNSFIGSSIYKKFQCVNIKIYSHTEISIFKNNIKNNDIIINCCGVNRDNDEFLYNGNYIFIKDLVDIINFHTNITFINISSLMVSDLNNTSTFSKTKILGDNYINNNFSKNNKYTILRLCNILDNGIKPYNNNFIYTLLYEKQHNIINPSNYNINNNELYILTITEVLEVIIDCIITPKNKILNVISHNKFYMHDIIKLIYSNNETMEKYNIHLLNTYNQHMYNDKIDNIVKECNIKNLINNIKT